MAIAVGNLLFSAVEVIVFPGVCWSVFVSGCVVRLIGAGGSSLHFGDQGRGNTTLRVIGLTRETNSAVSWFAYSNTLTLTLTLMRATVDVNSNPNP